MRRSEILILFDYNYWANRQILATCAELSDEQFRAPSNITTRDLRGTLVHTPDVEWSWRLRLRGEPAEGWGPEAELAPDDFPAVAALAEHWRRDEVEMRAWLESLDDSALAGAPAHSSGKDRFPLWYYLMHMAIHSQQQRSDAAVLLTNLGHSPGDVEFLDYADWAKAGSALT